MALLWLELREVSEQLVVLGPRSQPPRLVRGHDGQPGEPVPSRVMSARLAERRRAVLPRELAA